MANTLAYFCRELVAAVKGFIVPGLRYENVNRAEKLHLYIIFSATKMYPIPLVKDSLFLDQGKGQGKGYKTR